MGTLVSTALYQPGEPVLLNMNHVIYLEPSDIAGTWNVYLTTRTIVIHPTATDLFTIASQGIRGIVAETGKEIIISMYNIILIEPGSEEQIWKVSLLSGNTVTISTAVSIQHLIK